MAWQVVSSFSRDRARFVAGRRRRFDESNRHGDALDFNREDFSLKMHGDGTGTPPELDLAMARPAWAPMGDFGPVAAQVGKVVSG